MARLVQMNIDGLGASICKARVDFETINPVIPNGVIAYEVDTKRYKMGDGVSPYNKLLYASGDVRFSGKGKKVIGATIPPYIPN